MSPGMESENLTTLAILGNPTFKPPPRGSQEITNGSHGWSSKSLPSVGTSDFKDFKLLKK